MIREKIEGACFSTYIKGYIKGQEDLAESIKEKIEAYTDEHHSDEMWKEDIFNIIDKLIRWENKNDTHNQT